jgi:uncharacterized membrane protein YcaP (DUF421 family)
MNGMVGAIASQSGLAALHYAMLVVLFRLAGKRLAGQTTTFDLVVLIGLTVALQGVTLRPGRVDAAVFLVTVFGLHLALATACRRWRRLRRLVRGAPRPLVEDGRVSYQALEDERMSYDELLAGLRKAGIETPAEARLAILEETGHVSAVRRS